MFKSKYIISLTLIVSFLVITSSIKNKTRVIEKQISNYNSKILFIKNNINEAQLDFYYLTSPAEIEKRLNIIGFDNYQPIKHSKIFLDISEFTKIENRFSNLKTLYEKKFQK